MAKRLLFRCFVVLVALVSWCCMATAQTYNLAPSTTGGVYVHPDSTGADAVVRLYNWGSTDVTDFTYNLYYMDTQETEGPIAAHLDTPIPSYESALFKVRVKPGAQLGSSDVIMTIDKVMGEYNSASIGYTYITRYTVRNVPTKRILMEDYTGLWCQYCPRGLVVMESLERLYPDQFVGVSIHCGDALDTQAYGSSMESKWASNKPSVWGNRKNKVNTIDGLSDWNELTSTPAVMNVNVKATWDETENNINVTTEVIPCMEVADGTEYALAYVLTADSLYNDEWRQVNNYSEWQSYTNAPPELDKFKEPVDPVVGLCYNHIALASQGIENGISGSLDGEFVTDEPKYHTTTFYNIDQYRLIQRREMLAITAMVINTATGHVENVATCRVGDGSTNMMKDLSKVANKTLTGVYSLDGRKLAKPTKGVNILHYSDGTVSKVMCK